MHSSVGMTVVCTPGVHTGPTQVGQMVLVVATGALLALVSVTLSGRLGVGLAAFGAVYIVWDKVCQLLVRTFCVECWWSGTSPSPMSSLLQYPVHTHPFTVAHCRPRPPFCTARPRRVWRLLCLVLSTPWATESLDCTGTRPWP